MTYRRIATEEAFAPAELLDCYRRMLHDGRGDKGFQSLWGFYLGSAAERPRAVVRRLADLGAERIADMDAAGIDHQVLALTAPGTNVLDAVTARSMATLANDVAAQAVRDHPDRFTALAAVAWQEPDSAVAELERAVSRLGMCGVIANSHVQGRYLDDQRFWPVLEAAERLDVPVYLHPNTPNDRMVEPLHEAGLDGAIYGFAVETGMHLLRIITSGVFDRFPRLKLVVGHLGEALPFWLPRIDHFHAAQVASGRYPAMKALQLRPSDYLRRNVWYTTSGMAWQPGIMFVRDVVGADRVLYAMDYPYQYVADEVRHQDELPLDAAELREFFEGIATRLFHLTV
ncbi:amidohydrolase family protein [Pseudonocardia hierapolitana]|uniref:amidohydrolase family protein n=1 Tax=Pseudonocardia hierapolitana TaxID=1128676 RepID=UPI001BB020C7|nr:amidohydrolase family protein [Pseudonocardia hierapolitana]